MLKFYNCILLATFLLLCGGAVKSRVAAIKLNLTETCALTQIYFCVVKNIAATYDEPLVVANSSAPQLTELVLRNSVIGVLPREIFLQAPNLHVFVMHNCGLNRINDYDFKQARALNTLVLQRNRLFNIPEKAFSQTSALESLHLGQNTIHMLHRTSFAGLRKLTYLSLQQNSIRTLPQQVFDDLINLKHIDLSSNEIETITAQTFAKNSKLQTVVLSDNKFSVFETNTFQHLPHMFLLDISNSSVDELSLQSIDTLLAQNADLKRCVIAGSAIKVHAGNNQLTGITIGDKLPVRELELHGNQIETLDDFVGMLNLQRLDISKNKLQSLRTSRSPLFLPLPSLLNLNVASNQLQNLSVENFLMLQKLTHLDLAFNHLLELEQEIFEPLRNLRKFYIEGNRLHTFDFEAFLKTHDAITEMGIFDKEWQSVNGKKFVNFLRDRHIQLPIRFISNNILEQHSSIRMSDATTKTPGSHHHHSDFAVSSAKSTVADEKAFSQKQIGLSGIHPYWTTRDILAVVTLVFVLMILLLQLYRILQEEHFFLWCCQRNNNILFGAGAENHRRLDEEDSEV